MVQQGCGRLIGLFGGGGKIHAEKGSFGKGLAQEGRFPGLAGTGEDKCGKVVAEAAEIVG